MRRHLFVCFSLALSAARLAPTVGAQGGTWSKLGANRYQRSASGNTPATEFIFSAGLDGQGADLTQGGRALRRTTP